MNVPTPTVTIPMFISAAALASTNVDDRYDRGVSVTKTIANRKTEGSCRAPFDARKMSFRTAARAADRLGE